MKHLNFWNNLQIYTFSERGR